MSDPQVTRVEPLRPRGLRVRVHLDRGEPLEVALEALERLGLGVGDPLPSNRRQHLEDADHDVRIGEAALNLLSYRARTRTELGKRLRGKGFRPARIDACLDRLEARGLLDDVAVASSFVRDRLQHRPRGQARLVSELRAKGVEGETADQVVEDVFDEEGVTERDLAERAALGWIARQGAELIAALRAADRSPESYRARRRLHGYLARRGFRGAALLQALDRASREPS